MVGVCVGRCFEDRYGEAANRFAGDVHVAERPLKYTRYVHMGKMEAAGGRGETLVNWSPAQGAKSYGGSWAK
jgi:hypothetical protein